MRHRLAGLLRCEIGRLQLKIPARLAIRVVDRYRARQHLQPWPLGFDDTLILRDETIAEKSQGRRYRKPAEQVPRRDEIQAAQVVPDRGIGELF
jgi:hypothetical protein